jgi:hypothetical protein
MPYNKRESDSCSQLAYANMRFPSCESVKVSPISNMQAPRLASASANLKMVLIASVSTIGFTIPK